MKISATVTIDIDTDDENKAIEQFKALLAALNNQASISVPAVKTAEGTKVFQANSVWYAEWTEHTAWHFRKGCRIPVDNQDDAIIYTSKILNLPPESISVVEVRQFAKELAGKELNSV